MSTYLYIYTRDTHVRGRVYIVYEVLTLPPPTLPCPLLRTVTVCRVEHLPVDRLQFVRIAMLTRDRLPIDPRYFYLFVTLSTSRQTATIQQGIRKGCATLKQPLAYKHTNIF